MPVVDNYSGIVAEVPEGFVHFDGTLSLNLCAIVVELFTFIRFRALVG